MVPPPSAVMQPSMATPAQSMLRRPAASAAVIPCAVSAATCSQCSTKSLEGRFHIKSSREFGGTYVVGSTLNSPQAKLGTSTAPGGCPGLMEERHHGLP